MVIAVKTASWGRRHGHLALVLNDDKYCLVTGITTHTTACLNIPPIMPTTLANNMALAHCVRIMAGHNLKCQEYWKQEAVDAVIVDKIVCEGVNTTKIEELDDDFVRYIQTTKSITAPLHHKWCIVTTLEQKQAAAAFHIQWDLTSHIMKFAQELNK
jgi:hypothetical protein